MSGVRKKNTTTLYEISIYNCSDYNNSGWRVRRERGEQVEAAGEAHVGALAEPEEAGRAWAPAALSFRLKMAAIASELA
jgi:hypothetical protein